ncbi:hypothetical protein B0T16DRAFT_388631 [Cercophora newfieldiana]|uniref:Uncharacterized protein n=1 Tax=Cercophora newfieldiana TaxID=92897 RepID=A0AA39Y983_9PEZI|nr:hypothetical protein B0T16DRAFT_388631 [Cercophora newfieldiana]
MGLLPAAQTPAEGVPAATDGKAASNQRRNKDRREQRKANRAAAAREAAFAAEPAEGDASDLDTTAGEQPQPEPSSKPMTPTPVPAGNGTRSQKRNRKRKERYAVAKAARNTTGSGATPAPPAATTSLPGFNPEARSFMPPAGDINSTAQDAGPTQESREAAQVPPEEAAQSSTSRAEELLQGRLVPGNIVTIDERTMIVGEDLVPHEFRYPRRAEGG